MKYDFTPNPSSSMFPKKILNTKNYTNEYIVEKNIFGKAYLSSENGLRIDTGCWSVNCSTLGFRGLFNYPHQLKLNFLLIVYAD